MKIYYNNNLKDKARKLRQSGNLAEALLWRELRGRRILNYQFSRQKPIGNYIVDFYCSKLKLVIEIDGMSHDWKLDYDTLRTQYIENLGIKILRFKDSEVRKNISNIVSIIESWVMNNEQPPNPL